MNHNSPLDWIPAEQIAERWGYSQRGFNRRVIEKLQLAGVKVARISRNKLLVHGPTLSKALEKASRNEGVLQGARP